MSFEICLSIGFWNLEFEIFLLPRAKNAKIRYDKGVTKSAYIFSLPEILDLSPDVVGEKAWKLSNLAHQGISQPNTFVIPTTTLNEIAERNQLHQKIKDILSVTDLTDRASLQQSISQLKKVIRSQRIPQPIAHQLLEAYYRVLHNQPAVIRHSNLPNSPFRSNYTSRPVQGDANLVESLLESWGEQYQPHLLARLSQSLEKTGNLSNAFLVQTHYPQDQIEVSLSKNPLTNNKQHILIRSHPQAKQPHELQFDLQSNQLQPVPKDTQHQLSQNVIEQIARYTQQVKRNQLNHVALEWAVDQQQPLLLNIRPMADPQPSPSSGTITLGTTLVSGEAQGIGFVMPANSWLRRTQLPTAGILLCDQLTKNHLTLLPKVRGVITTTQPTQLMLTILKQHHLPTLLISAYELPQLIGKSLAIQGNQVQIHQPLVSVSQPVSTTISSPVPKVLALGGNGATLHLTSQQNSDGLYLDSWKIFKQLNLHPLYVADNPQKSHFREAMEQFFDEYTQHQHHQVLYRSLATTSLQMAGLKQANEYTNTEVNPNLGNRGAIFYLAHPQLLQLELDMIAHLSQRYQLPISWVSTFTRTPSELTALIHLVNDYNAKHAVHIPVWMEINTPAEALQIDRYKLVDTSGVIFHLPNLNSLSFAIDLKQRDLAQLYPHDPAFSARLVKQSVELMSHAAGLPALVLMKDNNPTLIRQLATEVTGFIARPQHVDPIKYVLSHSV